MSCAGCIASVTNRLKQEGVEDPEVEIGSVALEYDGHKSHTDKLSKQSGTRGSEVARERRNHNTIQPG